MSTSLGPSVKFSFSFFLLTNFYFISTATAATPLKPRKYCNAHDKGPNDGLPLFVVLLLLLLLLLLFTYCQTTYNDNKWSSPPLHTTATTERQQGIGQHRHHHTSSTNDDSDEWVPVFFFFFFHCTNVYLPLQWDFYFIFIKKNYIHLMMITELIRAFSLIKISNGG